MQRLPDTSLTVALASGGREFFGWGQDRHLAADLFDAINSNTKATGQWNRGKAPKIPAFPRPQTKPKVKAAKRPTTVAEIYKHFQRR
ncbi:hypothetical protein [Streptomyces huasconensis]|uniref:hypothetical protein n=1 Tax=Streptomyces huasconensis TaxID=1854574 RepID=UPI0033CE7362